MNPQAMLRLFEAHREAEAARDIDAILETFVPDCFLETLPLGLRSEGRDAVRAAYERQGGGSWRGGGGGGGGGAGGGGGGGGWGALRGASRGGWRGVPP